jgi:hypothetical protein
MPGTPAYQDGTAVYGTAVLTIAPKANPAQTWTAVCDGSFSVSHTTRRVEQRNQYGEPVGAFAIEEAPTGRCTIYLPANKECAVGDTFQADVVTGVTWIVTEAETVYAADDYRKQNISFVKKLSS